MALGALSCTQRTYMTSTIFPATLPSAPAVTPEVVPEVVEVEVEVEVVEEQQVAEAEQVATKSEYMEFYDIFSDSRITSLSINLDELAEEFAYPIEESEVSSPYGIRSGRMHSGLDLRAPQGTPIYSIFDGEVTFSKFYKDYGNVILVSHDNGLETIYAHNSENLVEVGDEVSAGDKIALCGKTGNATGYHLHFEVRVSGKTINPEIILDVDNEYLQEGTLMLVKEPDGTITATLQAPENQSESIEIKPLDPSQSKGVLIDGKVYEAPQTTLKEVYHTVKSGDTLSGIAAQYSTTVSEICKLNNITTRTTIKTGQKLRIK